MINYARLIELLCDGDRSKPQNRQGMTLSDLETLSRLLDEQEERTGTTGN